MAANSRWTDGELEARHAQGLVAVNAVASLAATQPRAKKFVDALWGDADAGRVGTVLRGIALHDGAAALRGGVSGLGARIGRASTQRGGLFYH